MVEQGAVSKPLVEGNLSPRRQFAQVPDALTIDRRVSDSAHRLWARLDHYAGKNGRAFPGKDALASDLGVSVATVGRAITNLVETGWVTRARRGFSNVIDTTLNDVPVPVDDKPAGHTGKLKYELTDTGSAPRTTGKLKSEPTGKLKSEPTGKLKSELSKEGDPLEGDPSALKTSASPADAVATGDGYGTEVLPCFDLPAVSASKPTKTKSAGDEDEARAIVAELTRLYADTVKAAGGTVTGSLMAAVGRNLKTHVVKDGLGVEALRGPVVAAAGRGERGVTRFLAAPKVTAPAQSFREQERARVEKGMAESAARISEAFPDGLPDLGLKPIPGVSVPYGRRRTSGEQYPQHQDRAAITATAEYTDPWEN
jgi:hypothetical protein